MATAVPVSIAVAIAFSAGVGEPRNEAHTFVRFGRYDLFSGWSSSPD